MKEKFTWFISGGIAFFVVFLLLGGLYTITPPNGPVDAAYKTIDKMIKRKTRLLDYQIRSVTVGKDAQELKAAVELLPSMENATQILEVCGEIDKLGL